MNQQRAKSWVRGNLKKFRDVKPNHGDSNRWTKWADLEPILDVFVNGQGS